MVVWALFDDGDSSVKHALGGDKDLRVISIGINDNPNLKDYFKIDLSIQNRNLIKQLNQLPKPDIIMASPPCESWSGADCGGTMFKAIDENNWNIANKKYFENYNSTCHKNKRRNFYQKVESMLNGVATITATIKIIEHFKPKVWIIENPQTSKTWKFQKHFLNWGGVENLVHYSAYSHEFSKKPTIFKSNIKLELRTTKEKSNSKRMSHGSYDERSAIPHELIRDIFRQIS